MSPKKEVAKDKLKFKGKRVAVTEVPQMPAPSGPSAPAGPSGTPLGMQLYIPTAMYAPGPSTALRLDLSNFDNNPNALPLLANTPLGFQLMNTTANTAHEDGSSSSINATIKEHNDQLARAIFASSEQLKRTLSDMQHRQYTSLFQAAEEKSLKKLNDKEVEIQNLKYRIHEHEQNEGRMRNESQFWRNLAAQMQARATALQTALREAMIRGGRAEGGGSSEADQESSHVDPNRVEPTRMFCRVCGKRVTSMMLFECSHVCVCKECDETTTTCPVCHSVKTGSVEVFFE